MGSQFLAKADLSARVILSGGYFSGWIDLKNSDGITIAPGEARIFVTLNFYPVSQPTGFKGVLNSYYPLRENCRVTLYQDTKVSDNFNPCITLDNEKSYNSSCCWDDLSRYDIMYRHVFIRCYLVSVDISASWNVVTASILKIEFHLQKFEFDL